jgi:predicted nucleotidyltransferase
MTAERQLVLHFLSGITQWAASQPEILALALVGSHARNAATAASDLDLVIIATEPDRYLKDSRWAQSFGTVDREQIENYGRLTSLRVWYAGSFQVEYGFADERWSALPIDEGTKRVISEGMQILLERGSILSRLKETEEHA